MCQRTHWTFLHDARVIDHLLKLRRSRTAVVQHQVSLPADVDWQQALRPQFMRTHPAQQFNRLACILAPKCHGGADRW